MRMTHPLPPTTEETSILGKSGMPEATAVVDSIFDDLRDRSFLKWMFDRRGSDCFIGLLEGDPLHGIDLEAQEEIRKAWEVIIHRAILAERERIAKKYEAIAAQYPEGSEIAKDKLFQAQWVREDW